MTKADFISICNDRTINPNIALENEEVKKFLKKNKGNNSITCQLRFTAVLDLEF